MKPEFLKKLFDPVDARPLDVFRVLFGLVLALQFFTFWKSDFIGQGILTPKFLFTYDWLPFIRPLPEAAMQAVLACTLIASLLIATGRWVRTAAAVYLVCFTYLFLLEESYYNNHFYFILLLCIFFLFYSPRRQGGANVIPRWLLWLFRFQVIIVYFYGGLAKLNADWLLHQQPVRELVQLNAEGSPFPSLTSGEFAVHYLTYGGLLFDLAIGFLLLYRPTLKTAIILTVVFHVSNFWIFNFGEGGTIGVFPLLMMGANVLFATAEDLEKAGRRLGLSKRGIPDKKRREEPQPAASPLFRPGMVVPFLAVFVALQLALPARHWLVPGHTDWTGQQQWFSWRMKISAKKVQSRFVLRRFEGDEPATVEPLGLLNTMQVNMMGQHADMIYKFVQHLKKDLRERLGIERAIINAEIKVSFNGRPAQYFVDPSRDLYGVSYHPCGPNDWIMELENKPPAAGGSPQ